VALELATRERDFAEQFARLLAERGEDARSADAVVAAIVEDVQRRGDVAVLEFTEKLDRVALTPATMAIGKDEIAAALRAAPKDAVAALRLAAKRIAAYHRKQMPKGRTWTDAEGIALGQRAAQVLVEPALVHVRARALPEGPLGHRAAQLAHEQDGEELLELARGLAGVPVLGRAAGAVELALGEARPLEPGLPGGREIQGRES